MRVPESGTPALLVLQGYLCSNNNNNNNNNKKKKPFSFFSTKSQYDENTKDPSV